MLTTALQANEKPRRAQLRAGRGCDRRFVRGGLGVAIGEALNSPTLRGSKLSSCLSGREGLGCNGTALVGAEPPLPVRSVEHCYYPVRASSFFPVLADCRRLSFGSDLAAEATQLLCCFVLHGGVYAVKLTSSGSNGAAFGRLPESILCGLLSRANASFGFRHCGTEIAEEHASDELAVHLGNAETCGLHGILASRPHITKRGSGCSAYAVLVGGLAVDHRKDGGLELRGFGECCFVHGDTLPNRLGYARGKIQNLKFSFPNTEL